MTTVTYDFDNAISEIKKLVAPYVGGDDYDPNESLQYQLETIMVCYHQCQEVFHGVAGGDIQKKYQEMLDIIDGNGGFIKNTETLVNLTNVIYQTVIEQGQLSEADKYSSYKNEIVNVLSNLKTIHDQYAICESYKDFTIDANVDDVDINIKDSGYSGKSNVGVIFEQMSINLDNYEDILSTIKNNYTNSIYQYIDNQDNIEKTTECLNSLTTNYETFYLKYVEILTYLKDIIAELVKEHAEFQDALTELNNNLRLKDTSTFGVNTTPSATTSVPTTTQPTTSTNDAVTPVIDSAISPMIGGTVGATGALIADGTTETAIPSNTPQSESNRNTVPTTGTEPGTHYNEVNGQYFDLYVPKNVEEDKPLIVFLPGIGAYGSEANLQGDGGKSFQNGIEASNPNAYVMSLQYPGAGGADYDVDKMMAAIYDTIDKYGIDRSRVSICGYSKGSYVMPRLINKDPELFSSAAFIATNAGNTENLTNLVNIPVRAYYGTADTWASPTPGLVDRINKAGGNAELVTYQGQGHGYMPGKAIESGMIDWMLEQHK